MVKSDCELVLSDLFEYDFSACFYTLLKNIGWDLSKIEFEDKTLRNIQIGKLQKENPSLSKYLITNTDKLIDFYMRINDLTTDHIIIRQRDGIITTKPLQKINTTMPIDFRGMILKLIISKDRKKWLMIKNNGDVKVKGISHKPINISFYDTFKNFDYGNKTTIINSLEKLRLNIINSQNISWFSFPEDDGTFSIPIKNEGLIKFRKSILNMLDQKEIEKEFIWNKYIWPFAESLILYCHMSENK